MLPLITNMSARNGSIDYLISFREKVNEFHSWQPIVYKFRGSRSLGPARRDERLEVTVHLKRISPIPASALDGAVHPKKRKYLTHSEIESRHGANPTDIADVNRSRAAPVLSWSAPAPARRSVFLSGTVETFEKAFAVKLEYYEHPDKGTFRGRTGEIPCAELIWTIRSWECSAWTTVRLPGRISRGDGPVLPCSLPGILRIRSRNSITPGQSRRRRPVRGHHRARRRIPSGGLNGLFRTDRGEGAECQGGKRGPRAQCSHDIRLG